MTTPHFPTQRQRLQSARSMRWLVLLFASVLLHLIAFNWADGRIGMPSWHSQEQQVITTELHPAPVPVPPPPAPVAAAPKPKPKPRPQRRALPPPLAELPPVAETTTAPALPAADDTGTDAATGPVGTADAQAPQDVQASAQDGTSQETTTTSQNFNPPPSAELGFDVEAFADGKTWHGSGTYRWEATADSYTASVEVGMTIFVRITGLSSKSEGKIAGFGLAPVIYSEKAIRRPLVNTHFQHDNRKISFSASEAVFPYNGGEQDRASVVWQLASIGRGDAGRFTPGASFDVVVAGTRDAENWHFNVIGLEEVATAPYGKVNAWHVKRIPNPGSYEKTLEIWFAPEHEWYPVKVRQTEANGNIYDLALTKVASASAQ